MSWTNKAWLCALTLALASCGDSPAKDPDAEASVPDTAPPGTLDLEEEPETDLDRLRALGYADVGSALAQGAPTGILVFDAGLAARGLTLLSHAKLCRTELIDMEGRVLRSWSYEGSTNWDNTVLLPNGDLLVVGRKLNDGSYESVRNSRFLLRLGWDGTERWIQQLPVHHDAEALPDGRIASLTYAHRDLPQASPKAPVRDHALALLSANGELEEERWMWDVMRSAPTLFHVQPVRVRQTEGAREIDLFHSNSIEWMRRPELAARDPRLALGNVLFCMRHQDAVAIAKWETGELLWAWGQGKLSGPHDAQVLASGHILIFDNGLGRGWSRVLEVDPLTDEIVWEYQATPPTDFYTKARGACQRLENGNTLITESIEGRVFEITAEGELVWEYRTPYLTEDREPGVIMRARRYVGATYADFEERLAAGQPLPWVD